MSQNELSKIIEESPGVNIQDVNNLIKIINKIEMSKSLINSDKWFPEPRFVKSVLEMGLRSRDLKKAIEDFNNFRKNKTVINDLDISFMKFCEANFINTQRIG